MNKKTNKKGHFSKSTTKITATETSRKIEMEVPNEEAENVRAGLIKINHARGLYDDFFTLNQQFLKYSLSIGMKGRTWEVFVFLMSIMDYGNKILINQEILQKELKMSQGQVSKALSVLEKNKIVLKRKLDKAKYEYGFNYDILNPQLAFKSKSDKKNVEVHRDLISQETPYQKHYNIEGNIDLINGITGEVFHTIEETPTQRGKNIDTYYKKEKD